MSAKCRTGQPEIIAAATFTRTPDWHATGLMITETTSSGHNMNKQSRAAAVALCIVAAIAQTTVRGQQPPKPSEPVEKLGPALYRIGRVRVDTATRVLTVAGHINPVQTLEFIANTRGGLKAYESAVTLDTDGVDFNVGLLLMGLDVSHSRVPKRHFDPTPPEGDRVSITVEWSRGSERVRIPAEQLMFDKVAQQPVPTAAWVYTGSAILPDGRYLANVDGVVIGFVHSPAPIIEHVGGAGVNRYGQIVLNPNLGLDPDMPVTLTVQALSGER
jgi:hypothetical protein